MTAALFQQVKRIAQWRVSRWRAHPDYEDLEQEALLHAWEVIERGAYRHAVNTVAGRAADFAILEFLRSRRATRRVLRSGHAPDPELVSLDAIQSSALALDEPELDQRLDLPHEPDFTADCDARLDASDTVERLFAGSTPKECEALTRCFWRQETYREIGQAMGVTLGRAQQLVSGPIERFRRGQRAAGQFRRPGHCNNGHFLTPETSYTDRGGSRRCRACWKESSRRRYWEQKEKSHGD